MPNWKKVIVSGSNISQLNNDGVYLRNTGDGILSSSAQIATEISGAFTATSASLSNRIDTITGTFASTGSNSFKGVQTFSGSLLPEATEVFGLGSADYIWAELYVDGNSIYMRDAATNTFVTMSANNGVLIFENTVVSGSFRGTLIANNGILSSSAQISAYNKFLEITGDGVISSSAQIASDISGAFVAPSGGFSTRVTTLETATGNYLQATGDNVISSSAQIQAYDIFLEKLGDGVISSSAQLNNATIDGLKITNGQFTGSAKVDGTLTIGSQIIYPQGTNGFSVNENYDPSNSSTQTAYHYTSGTGRETVAFTLARTGQFTNGFGIYGTSSNNTFVTFGEQSNTKFEWRKGIGIQPLDLDGGLLLATLDTNGTLVVSGSVSGSDLRLNGWGSVSSSLSSANSTSASFSTRVTTLESAGGTTFSSSVASRLTSVEGYTLDNVTDNGSTTTNGITIGGLTVNGNATITGTLTAQQFNTEYVSASVIFQSGSTKFGDTSDDTHSFTGSIKLNTQTAATTDTDKFLVFDTGGQIKYRTGAQVLSDINPGGLISSSAQVDHDTTTNFVANEHIDHTSVSISAGSGLSGGGTIASTRTLTLDTSSAHFTDGVKKKLNTEGVISSSAQLTTEFDTRYLNTVGDGVISSSAQLTTEFDTRYLNTTGDGVISSSAQVTISSTTGYTTFSSSIASDIAALQGAGYVNASTAGGTQGSGSRLAVWTDTDTIRGYEGITVVGTATSNEAGLYFSAGAPGGIGRKTLHGSGGGTGGLFPVLNCGPASDSLGAHFTFTIHTTANRNTAFRAGSILGVWNSSGGNIQYNETSTNTFGNLPNHQVYPYYDSGDGNVYLVLDNNSGTSLYVTVNADVMTI